MVTRQRLALAKRAIDCYAGQDYETRELVIVCDGEDEHDELRQYAVRVCAAPLITKAYRRGSLSLGALRNAAMDLARGDIIAQWDDDDLSHSHRLSAQIAAIQGEKADACFMTDQLLLFARTGSIYWCDWTRPRGVPLPSPTIPGTLLCLRDATGRYPENGLISRRSEDAYFMRSLIRRVKVAHLSGYGWLYVYVSHGANTWHEGHHIDIIRATAMGAQDLIQRRHELVAGIAGYPLGEVVVRDHTAAEVYRLVAAGGGADGDARALPTKCGPATAECGLHDGRLVE
jgi:glycosyltransferase involved in cell wall biosynthesis